MKCIACGVNEVGNLRVVETRQSSDKQNIWRIRECQKCGERFMTTEKLLWRKKYLK